MVAEAEDALSWDGDDDDSASAPPLAPGWKAVGRGRADVGRGGASAAPAGRGDAEVGSDMTTGAHAAGGPSTVMLVVVGVLAGVYLLYSVGWVIGGLRMQASALFLIPGLMYQVGLWAAALSPLLWFGAVWALTRRSAEVWRLVGLVAGALLLIPWPFLMSGASPS